MRKAEGIEWGKKCRVWQETGGRSGLPGRRTAEGIWLALQYGILLLLGYGMLFCCGDVFPLGDALVPCVLFLPFCGFLFTAGSRMVKNGKKWNLGCAAALVLVGVVLHRVLIDSIITVVNGITPYINEYYTVHLPEIETAVGREVTLTPSFFLLIFLLLWQMSDALLRRRKPLFAILPGVVLVLAELLIGYAPKWPGLLCGLAGVFGVLTCCLGARTEEMGQLVAARIKSAGLLVGTALFVVAFLAMAGAEWTDALLAKQGRMLAYQHYIEQAAVTGNNLFAFWGESGKVNNHTPHYLGTEVLDITVTKPVKENVYLRGYVGDTYSSGNWKNRSEKEFLKNEWADDEAGFEILGNLYEKQKENARSDEQATYTVSYVKPQNLYAYLPYYTDVTGIEDELSVSGDSMLFRRRQSQIATEGLDSWSLFAIVENGTSETLTQTEKEYADYLPLYLELPEGLEQMDALGAELKAKLEQMDASGNEVYRALAAVCLVRDVVNSRVTYSQSLEKIPVGEDVVEYFLFEEGEGYCTHYASAGTLLFRELGIPARYVTGYVVEKESFSHQNGEKVWTGNVLDSDAHAWVEIYIEGVGWVPVEMIEGFDSRLDSMRLLESKGGIAGIYFEQNMGRYIYAFDGPAADGGLEDWIEAVSGEELAGQPSYMEESEEDTEQDETETTMIKRPDENAGTGGAAAQQQEEEEEESLPESATETSGQRKNGGAAVKNESAQTAAKAAAAAGGVVLLAGAGVFFFYRRKRKIRDSFYQKNCRKAIRSITAQMYRLLRKEGAFRGKRADDAAFREALYQKTELFSKDEVEVFWKIVEQAAYGDGEITGDDVRTCRRMYRKLLK